MAWTYDQAGVTYDNAGFQYDGGGAAPVVVATNFGRYRKKKDDFTEKDREIERENLRRLKKRRRRARALSLIMDLTDDIE